MAQYVTLIAVGKWENRASLTYVPVNERINGKRYNAFGVPISQAGDPAEVRLTIPVSGRVHGGADEFLLSHVSAPSSEISPTPEARGVFDVEMKRCSALIGKCAQMLPSAFFATICTASLVFASRKTRLMYFC
jgi:hypothetical protein